MSQTMTRSDCTESSNHAYFVSTRRHDALIAFSTRHDAVGFAAIWESERGEETSIEAQAHHSESELPTLKNT